MLQTSSKLQEGDKISVNGRMIEDYVNYCIEVAACLMNSYANELDDARSAGRGLWEADSV